MDVFELANYTDRPSVLLGFKLWGDWSIKAYSNKENIITGCKNDPNELEYTWDVIQEDLISKIHRALQIYLSLSCNIMSCLGMQMSAGYALPALIHLISGSYLYLARWKAGQLILCIWYEGFDAWSSRGTCAVIKHAHLRQWRRRKRERKRERMFFSPPTRKTLNNIV